ncbi:DUF1433 domain-containing protein [Listeria monocytogenes]|uniref:DUF1433 domain-containing protein n=1 Tax=Listeria monocytogenes serotype 1/2a TaxID=1906951 RepID=A0A9P1YL90_LISMN|nr:DUF1433 domain-containing protein [Listeria monocytogenes]EAF3074353.1 DUF1433 domain-containing protein [Listeria monocytogenes serotype 1/2a]EAC5234505.1 DUF1433 domain-containing protein [Listeria monocytogenes]EAC8514588.1 DUF1433 domain-containing protein [Listeria monocytogenes]EAF3114392.1 DUF1433 domain-containing protein [Listeria monocytogenes]EAF3115842.1 DUF1433 domain-containing protein [Listeria monocytogenes]
MKKHQESIEKEAFLKEEAPRIEQFLKYNYNNINKLSFTHVKVSPMGIPYIEGFINNDENLFFSATIYDEHFENSISIPEDVSNWRKNEINKTVSEIQQEENKTP